jgi:serine/alanine adding enzyme
MIRITEWTGSAERWDSFVASCGDSTVMHLHAWKGVLKGAYGCRTHFLAALEGDEIRGVLPLALIRSPLLGKSLVSMPFMDYGGACVGQSEEVEEPLVSRAREIAAGAGAKLVLRYLRKPALALPCSLEKVTMLLDLGPGDELLWKRLPPERRNRIRKGQKNGLQASFHGAEGVDDFYAVFAENMRDLGSPVHSLGFFREVVTRLGDHARIVLVRLGDRAIGAGLMLLHGGMISIPWVSSLRTFFDKCPNQVLYWEAMRYGIAHGYRTLDLGRSSRDSGTFEAKRQWGAEPVQLYWHYDPESALPPGEEVKRMSWAVGVWRHLPLPVVNTVGPWLRRGIPN